MDQFTLTLHSNTNCVFKEHNRQSNFRVHLGQTLHLRGSYDVALFEIFYPTTFANLRTEDCNIVCEYPEGLQERFEISELYFTSAAAIVDNLNTLMDGHFRIVNFRDNLLEIIFNTSTFNNKYYFTNRLMDILGIKRVPFIGSGENIRGFAPCDPRRGYPKIISVHSDIIKEQPINNMHQKMLRCFSTMAENAQYGFLRNKSFEKLLFVPLCKNNMEYIDFNIKDENLQEISFEHGTLTIVLVFKRTRYE